MAEVMLKNVRLSFPDLFYAVEYKSGDGKPRWNATFLVEPGSANDKAILAAREEEAKNLWGAKAAATLKALTGQKNQDCYLDGNTKEYDGYEGMFALSSHRAAMVKGGAPNAPPLIVDKDLTPLSASSGKPYAGCYVNAKVSIYCQGGENPGIRSSFTAVQFAGDGDAFSANTPSVSDFDALDVGADAEGMV